jgi:hypothetical protein
MMKTQMLLIGFLCLLASCKEIGFDQPQPKGKKILSAFPKSLHGKYLTLNDDGAIDKDTVVISASEYHFAYFEAADTAHNDEYDHGVLCDTLVLKSYKGYYFLNFIQRPLWVVRVLHPEKNGDLTLMAPEQENVEFSDYIKHLAGEIKIDSFQHDKETRYRIDPSPKELVTLIEKGYFSKAALKRIK